MGGSDNMPRDDEEPGKPGDRISRLNASERRCLALVAKGKSSKIIGRQLNLSPHTIDGQVRSACAKLGAANRTEAAQIFMAATYSADSTSYDDTSKLRHENSSISGGRNSSNKKSSAGESDGSDEYDRERIHRLVSLSDSSRGRVRPRNSHLIATIFWGTNNLSTGRRILTILAIAFGLVVAVGTVINGLTALSKMLEAPGGAVSNRGGGGSKNMLKERLAAANKVATDLAEAEAAFDLAIAKMGALVTSLPSAQAAVKLSPVVGDTAYGHIQGAVASLFAARSNLVAFHHEMDGIKNHVGLKNFRVTGAGDAVKVLEPTGLNDDGTVTASETKAA